MKILSDKLLSFIKSTNYSDFSGNMILPGKFEYLNSAFEDMILNSDEEYTQTQEFVKSIKFYESFDEDHKWSFFLKKVGKPIRINNALRLHSNVFGEEYINRLYAIQQTFESYSDVMDDYFFIDEEDAKLLTTEFDLSQTELNSIVEG